MIQILLSWSAGFVCILDRLKNEFWFKYISIHVWIENNKLKSQVSLFILQILCWNLLLFIKPVNILTSRNPWRITSHKRYFVFWVMLQFKKLLISIYLSGSYHWTEIRLSKCLGDILPSYWGRISMALWTDRHSGNHYMTTFTVHTFNMQNVFPSFKVAILWPGSRVVLLNKIQCHFHCSHVPRLGMVVTFNLWSNLSFKES